MSLGQSFLRESLPLRTLGNSILRSIFLGLVVALAAAAAEAADHPSSAPARGSAPLSIYAGVCDSSGDGFFLLPGTDRCLMTSGLAYGGWQRGYGFDGRFFEADGTPNGGGTIAPVGALRGSPLTLPLFAYTAAFGNGFSAMLTFENRHALPAGGRGTRAGDQDTAESERRPDAGGAIRLDQPWGAGQFPIAASGLGSRLSVAPAGASGGEARADSDFGGAVRGGLEVNTDIAHDDKLWLQAAFERGDSRSAGGNTQASSDGPTGRPNDSGAGISPQSYNFGWNAQVPSDCVYTGLTAATASCDKPWGGSFSGAFKHFWSPDLSSSVFGSPLSTGYDPKALAGLGGAVTGIDTRETRIGGGSVWTPSKGLDIGTEFMYLHLTGPNPRGVAPNYGATSLNAGGVPTFKSDSSGYEGRIRVQGAF